MYLAKNGYMALKREAKNRWWWQWNLIWIS